MDTKKEIAELKRQIALRDSKIISLTIAGTKFAQEETVLAEAAGNALARHFTVHEAGGQLIVKPEDKEGRPIFSSRHPGETADLEEATKLLLEDRYKHYLMPDELRPGHQAKLRQEPKKSPHGDNNDGSLSRQYQEAKEKRDVQTMTSLKHRMHEQGLRTPL